MDQMILCGRFLDFISEFVEITNDDLLWEYYLHYPFLELSFDEFKEDLDLGMMNHSQNPILKQQ